MDTVLFDLDGTLLPLEMDTFMEAYFRELSLKCVSLGFEPRSLVHAVLVGVEAMQNNDGSLSNEERFFQAAGEVIGQGIRDHKPVFREFYLNEFHRVKDEAVQPTPLAAQCIAALKEKGYQLVLATNAIFPREGILARMAWAGLQPEDFALITTYEEFSYAKPNLGYYREILLRIGKQPQDCLMVGNDVTEDMCAAELGMDTFLITDCLINKDNVDISQFTHGTLADFYHYALALPVVGH
ncbi:MAG: HAD family hydrolase [Limnochordia bacterium]